MFSLLALVDGLTHQLHQLVSHMLRRQRIVQYGLYLLYLCLLDLYPIVQVSNWLTAQIGLLGQSYPSYSINSQNYLSIVLDYHRLTSDLFIDILHKNGLDEIPEFLLDLFFGQLEDVLHFRLQFEAYVLQREFLALLAYYTQKGVFAVFFIEDLFDVFVENRNKRLGYRLFCIDSRKHPQQLFIRNEEIPWEASSFLLQILVQPFFDLIDSYVDLSDLLHHAATAVDSRRLIADLLVEENGIRGDVFYDFLPLSLPTEEFLAFFGQHF